MNAIRRQYDIRSDDERIKFIQESAALISTLGSSVQREVYGHRVAEEGKISFEAMQMEIEKARKNRLRREKKAQEKIDLSPARNLQPKSRTIRYDDVKSARAEETLIALAMKDPALLDLAGELKPEAFSVALFANVYNQLQKRHLSGLGVSVASLEDLNTDEASHIAMIAQNQSGPVSEQAFRDCIAIIQDRWRKRSVSSDADLLALRNRRKESGGYHG